MYCTGVPNLSPPWGSTTIDEKKRFCITTDPPKIMSCPIVQLPSELQVAIIKSLASEPIQALIDLSCTCSVYRSLLAPDIFKAITLRNNEKSGSSLQAIANSRHSELVREIRYIGSAPGDGAGDDSYKDTQAVFPDVVRAALSGLKRFRNLQRLSVEFAFNLSSYDDWQDSFYMFDNEETEEQVQSAEKSLGWRALMAKSFEAVAQNKNLKSLQVIQLPPREVSVFRHPTFHEFLGTLDRFALSLWGDDNGAGWKTNTLEPYLGFLSKLDQFFFNHLHCTTEFSLKADEAGPIGLKGRYHAPLALNATQMPRLQSLHLEHIFICRELVNFLVGHADGLESMLLHNCYGGVNQLINDDPDGDDEGEVENGIHWHVLFNALADAKPKQLWRVEITPTELCYYYPYGDKGADESDETRKVRRILQEDPKRRLFAYKILDDKYGMLFDDEDENRTAFLRGDDQRAYDRLMEIFKANAARSSLS